jgi:hypothetical protein
MAIMMNKVRIEEAIGMPLAHAVTRVVPGHFKGQAFGRGHIIKEEDVPVFRSIGKEHIYALTLDEGEIHEEEAALRMARAVAGSGLTHTEPREGRVNLVAGQTGLVRINVTGLNEINTLGDMIVTTVHNHTVCREGTTVAGMRIVPLYIRSQKLDKMEEVAQKYQPVITVAPLKHRNIGLIITGNEVFKGAIQDGFSPIVHKKAEALGCSINNQAFVPDDSDVIARTIWDFQAAGSEVILCCSGMSVDPDDVTPEGIRKSGAHVYFYGLPVLPGAMFLYARFKQTHILGLPACVLHAPSTAFDILFPRVLTGEELTFAGTRELGHGGLCLGCQKCTFPICPFGK